MKTYAPVKTPFEEGQASAKIKENSPNPYLGGSIEHNNFELGRQFAARIFNEGARPFSMEHRP